ncbi:DNA primase [Aquipuribacter nitratireducens]|uniref:DNA primase n=1 Tax=Aquipuribacter nitratireducens TaxID=650104 RepID=A0ABW0GIA2_9MICO
MSSDARAALDQFVAALQRHFEAAASRRSELDPTVVAAYDELAAAFVAYDDALFDAFDEVTPFDLTDEDDEGDDEDDEDDEGDEDDDLDDEDDLDDDLDDEEDEAEDDEDDLEDDEEDDLDDDLDEDDLDEADAARRL